MRMTIIATCMLALASCTIPIPPNEPSIANAGLEQTSECTLVCSFLPLACDDEEGEACDDDIIRQAVVSPFGNNCPPLTLVKTVTCGNIKIDAGSGFFLFEQEDDDEECSIEETRQHVPTRGTQTVLEIEGPWVRLDGEAKELQQVGSDCSENLTVPDEE